MRKTNSAPHAVAGFVMAAAVSALMMLGACPSSRAAAVLPESETEISARLLRSWPRAGAWFTAMVQTSSNELVCYMASALISRTSPAVSALRLEGDALAIEIVARRQPKPTGDTIAVVVDGITVGRYRIPGRLHGLGYSTVLAAVPSDARQALVQAIHSGRMIMLASGERRVTTSLAQVDRAFAALQSCAAALPDASAARKGRPREVIIG
jgi:hypothetical protein